MALDPQRSEMFTEKVFYSWHRLMEIAEAVTLVRKSPVTGKETAAVGTLLTKQLIVCIVPENVTGAQRSCWVWFCLKLTVSVSAGPAAKCFQLFIKQRLAKTQNITCNVQNHCVWLQQCFGHNDYIQIACFLHQDKYHKGLKNCGLTNFQRLVQNFQFHP